MRKILIATSNPGKLRDFAGAALRQGVEIAGVPDFASLPSVVEEGGRLQPTCSGRNRGRGRFGVGG
jgi:inosine/xanthosine triphosphate pyrophosphatase family protein